MSVRKVAPLARIEPSRRGTRIRGPVLPSAIPAILDTAASRHNWPMDTLRAGDLEWREVDGVVTLFDSPAAGAGLVTQWHAADGPVMPLMQHRRATLVRCPDGTAGWTRAKLGAVVAPLRCPSPRLSLDALDDAVAPLLGVSYRLGGASHDGFDCSALVQRIYLDAFRILLPRHSRDQMLAFAIERHASRARARPGDVVFLEMERGCHAGVVRGGGIVHAAHSRGVVADSLAAFRRSGRVIGVGRAEIAFAAALLTAGLPASALWGPLIARALLRVLK